MLLCLVACVLLREITWPVACNIGSPLDGCAACCLGTVTCVCVLHRACPTRAPPCDFGSSRPLHLAILTARVHVGCQRCWQPSTLIAIRIAALCLLLHDHVRLSSPQGVSHARLLELWLQPLSLVLLVVFRIVAMRVGGLCHPPLFFHLPLGAVALQALTAKAPWHS